MRYKKFFSIVTSVYNGEAFIGETIQSIKIQTFKNYEYIVVDGGSIDKTRSIINKNSKYIHQIIFKKDKNMYEGISRGFKKANGKYYLWINSDDFLTDKNSLKRLYLYLKKNDNDWITCRTCFYDQKNKKIKSYFPLIYPRYFINKGWCHSGAWGFVQQENTIFKSDLYKKVGGLDIDYKQAGDFYLWKKFSKYANLHSANIKFACQRIWEQQMTKEEPIVYFDEINKKNRRNVIYLFRILLSFIMFFFIKNRN